jgi:hypothetical protein
MQTVLVTCRLGHANLLMGFVLLVVAAQGGEAAKVLATIVATQCTVANQLETPYPKTASGVKRSMSTCCSSHPTSQPLGGKLGSKVDFAMQILS